MDDSLSLITSFNLFAFAGNGLADDEIADELGVVISSQNANKEIIKSFPEPKLLPKPQKESSSTKKKYSPKKRKRK